MGASPTWAETDSSLAARDELLIYDGDCGFCTVSANWYARIAGDVSRIAPWQSLALDNFALTSEQTSESLWWYSHGRASSGADACADALKACNWPWKGLGFVLAFAPVRWVARRTYPVIARNRHKLPGGTAACEWQPPSA
jgi:predicted DCC family thiol-disulfide oxidoreductase YuxK